MPSHVLVLSDAVVGCEADVVVVVMDGADNNN